MSGLACHSQPGGGTSASVAAERKADEFERLGQSEGATRAGRDQIRRPRFRQYGPEVSEALVVAWRAANRICSKRLIPFLPELIPVLERHGHLAVSDEVRAQLFALSPATADRLLQPFRARDGIRGMTTTKPGALLKRRIPIRTFADWDDVRPGFFEADLVAHCGHSTEGAFLHTLALTDVATCWFECLPLLRRSQYAVKQALDHAGQLVPFPILGLDTDNGGEFINDLLLEYCARQITFTRGRVAKKNDRCFVEQKNGSVVRQVVGYDRFEGEPASPRGYPATCRTLSGAAPRRELLSAFDEARDEDAGRESRSAELRPGGDSAPAIGRGCCARHGEAGAAGDDLPDA